MKTYGGNVSMKVNRFYGGVCVCVCVCGRGEGRGGGKTIIKGKNHFQGDK